MSFSEKYFETYQNLPEELADLYPDLSFRNHCYLRIALDNVFGTRWNLVLKRPVYKHLKSEDRERLLKLLKTYKEDKQLLLEHNKISLSYRLKK